MRGLNREAILALAAEIQARADAAKAAEVPLTPEQQRKKELDDEYKRGYQDGIAAGNNYSWRL